MRDARALVLGSLVLLAGCGDYDTPPPASPPTSYTQNNAWNTYVNAGAPATVSVSTPTTTEAGDPAHVVVLETTHLDRPAEVVGVVDVHEKMASTDLALEELRRKAARLGADAVVGVEFHHGEGEGEPTHLSGLAVRWRVGE